MLCVCRLAKGMAKKTKNHIESYVRYRSVAFIFHDVLSIIIHKIAWPPALLRALARRNNEGLMRQTLRSYVRTVRGHGTPDTSIPPIHDEDYESHWGKINYRGKVVLDIGADVGSTADFFLKKGARMVIAVEGSKLCFEQLRANAPLMKNVIPLFIFIENPEQIESLIQKWTCDVVKIDIEGGELNLLKIEDEAFRRVPEFIVELHSNNLFKMMLRKCARNNYKIMDVNSYDSPLRIVYARRMKEPRG